MMGEPAMIESKTLVAKRDSGTQLKDPYIVSLPTKREQRTVLELGISKEQNRKRPEGLSFRNQSFVFV